MCDKQMIFPGIVKNILLTEREISIICMALTVLEHGDYGSYGMRDVGLVERQRIMQKLTGETESRYEQPLNKFG
jgi:hypothetical protein